MSFASAAVGPALAPLRIEWHGRVAYRQGLELQRERHRRVSAGLLPNTLLMLEHDPVITLGRASKKANVLTDVTQLHKRGIEVVETGRGGDVTYHGPGQVMGYFIVKLEGAERDVGRFAHKLEECVLRTTAQYGVIAERVQGLRGLWIGNDKVAAIGVRMVEWTSCHGLALNVTTDPHAFLDIIPCGLHGRGVTSLAAHLPGSRLVPSLPEVANSLATHAGSIFGMQCERPASLALPAVETARLGRDLEL